MGIGRLCDLKKHGDQGLAAAAAVLHAELADGTWTSKEEFLESYPGAVTDDSKLRIFLDADNLVDVTVNFVTGMMLIDYAGRMIQAEPRHAVKGRAA
ncbi:hypothetical protein [Rhizobium sp. BK176]|uniref:hypothetical protein n=1 Tax=Rhizobium sp. BK176 TaxID=2587071 RepID=UPI00216857B2|nr:hypothetical protein [Rhizobium sp. BK176]MCS4092639.1 hypothetical protein [Rhizobium sp. BK176]